MKTSFFILIFAFSAVAITAQARKAFPYQSKVDDLPNGLRDEIVHNKPAKITDEDKTIKTYPICVKAADVSVTPVGKEFE